MKIMWWSGIVFFALKSIITLKCLLSVDITGMEMGYCVVESFSGNTCLILSVVLLISAVCYIYFSDIGYYNEYRVSVKRIYLYAALACGLQLLQIAFALFRGIDLSLAGYFMVYRISNIFVFIAISALTYIVCRRDYYIKLNKSRGIENGKKEEKVNKIAVITAAVVLILEIILRVVF